MTSELARKIPLHVGRRRRTEVLLQSSDAFSGSHGRHHAPEQADTDRVLGFEFLAALLGSFRRRLVRGLIDAQSPPFHLGAAPGHGTPEGQRRFTVETQPLCDHSRPEGQDWGSIDADRLLGCGSAHAFSSNEGFGFSSSCSRTSAHCVTQKAARVSRTANVIGPVTSGASSTWCLPRYGLRP